MRDLTGNLPPHAAGVAVSIVKLTAVAGVDTVPAALICVAVTLWLPSGSADVGANDHVPSAATVVAPAELPSIVTASLSPPRRCR
jgi:hypothetical protein